MLSRTLLLIALLAVSFSPWGSFTAHARAFPRMRENLNLSCENAPQVSIDIYSQPGGEKSPVMIKLFDAKEPLKSRRNSKVPPKTMEMFAVAQGLVHVNIRLQRDRKASTDWNPDLVRAAVRCVKDQIAQYGGESNKLFLMATDNEAGVFLEALATSPSQSRSDSLQLAGVVLVAPTTPTETAPKGLADTHVLLVDTAKSEKDMAETKQSQWMQSANMSIDYSAERKGRTSLLSEYGMASDPVTRHIIDFVQKRVKDLQKQEVSNSSGKSY